mgnify:CR=1 FL=1
MSVTVTLSSLQQALTDYFAPWVQALGLQVESIDAESVCLRPLGSGLGLAGRVY